MPVPAPPAQRVAPQHKNNAAPLLRIRVRNHLVRNHLVRIIDIKNYHGTVSNTSARAQPPHAQRATSTSRHVALMTCGVIVMCSHTGSASVNAEDLAPSQRRGGTTTSRALTRI